MSQFGICCGTERKRPSMKTETENERRKPPSLEIRLFGTFQVLVHGEPISALRSRQGQALFGLLVLRHAVDIDREALAFALWPDSSEAQARYNLRRNLTDLRHALGSESWRLLSPAPRVLRFDLAGAFVDVTAFDAAVLSEKREDWAGAAALYHGELLSGCDGDALTEERRRREQAYFDLLEKLANEAAERDPGEALTWLRRLIAADPLRETARRDLMRALSRRGELAAITEAYRDFRLYLHREMNAEPAPETVALYRELSLPERAAGSAPAAGLSAAPRRRPASLSRLIGRETETAAVCDALRIARLLTLAGAGGIGKTRLALAVAEAANDFSGGVWFVDLAPLTEGASVPPAILAALEVTPPPGQSGADALIAFLSPRCALLILDNCEHLIPSCAEIAQNLLTRCPHLKILATSRQPLGLMGETTRQVPPLELPPLISGRDSKMSAEIWTALRENSAVRLFAERAKLARPDWTLTLANAAAVSQICRRLDGLPLAIELAAARMAALSPDELAARLEDRFRLLSAGNRGAMPRHQSLTALLDWSHDLLSEAEQALFRRLAIFAGGWPLEAAEAVCGGAISDGRQIESADVVSLLASLVDKSLVVGEGQEGAARYRMLETVRQYAQGRLEADSGAAANLAGCHAEYYLALTLQAEQAWSGPEETAWLKRLEQEQDNLRAALAWLQKEERNAEKALRFACAISSFWSQRGSLTEGYSCLTDCLRAAGEPAEPALRAAALNRAGGMAHLIGDYAEAVAYFEAALALHRALGNKQGEALVMSNLGDVNSNRGEFGRAKPLLEQSAAISREIGDAEGETLSLSRLGYLAREQGDFAEARRLTELALALRRRVGDRLGEAWNLGSLGFAFSGAGDWAQAVSHFEQGLVIYRECGQRSGEAWSLTSLGYAARQRGDYAASRLLLEAGRAIYQELGLRASEAWNLDELGATLTALGEQDAARRVFYDALCISREIGGRRSEAIILFRLGHLFREEGEFVLARRFYAESAGILIEMDLPADLLNAAEGLAALDAQEGRPTSAARLCGASHAFRRTQSPPHSPTPLAAEDDDLLNLRHVLRAEEFAAAWKTGEALTLAQAVLLSLRPEAGDENS